MAGAYWGAAGGMINAEAAFWPGEDELPTTGVLEMLRDWAGLERPAWRALLQNMQAWDAGLASLGMSSP